MQLPHFYTSSIGQKLIMASTGLLLMAFLVVHLGLNATIFAADQGALFDRIAGELHHSWALHLLEFLVLTSLLVHSGQGLWLTLHNRAKRSSPYAISSNGALNPARLMGLFGAIIFVFLLLHLYQFWLPHTLGWIDSNSDFSLYQVMQTTFSQGWMVGIYLASCLAMAAHLFHGWRSAAITWGLRDRSIQRLTIVGMTSAVLVPLGLALIPLALLTGWFLHA